jgi:hypothetical protein
MPKIVQMNKKTLSGSFRPETVDLDARTVEVVFTTGEGGRRYDLYEGIEYIEELDVTTQSIRTARLNKGLSVIDSHNTYGGIDNVFGITEGYRIEQNQLIGTVRFADDELSDSRFRKIASGILRHVSLGYKVHKYFKSRGADDKLDTYRAVDWEPTELSFVPVSFETTNGVRAEQRVNEPTYRVEIEDLKMNKEQLARLALLQGSANRSADENLELETLLALQLRTANPPAPVAPTITPPAPVAPTLVRIEPQLDETAIRTAARTEAVADVARIFSSCSSAGLDVRFAETRIAAGDDIHQFRENAIAELGNIDSDFIVRNYGIDLHSDNRSDARTNEINAAVTAILHRSDGERVQLTDGARKYHAISLLDIGRMFAGKSGQQIALGSSPMQVAARAFHSTSDFPLILENVMNKNLAVGYVETPQTFRDLGRRTTHNDFRERHTYRIGDAPDLLPLGEHGEYQVGTFSEGKEKYGLGTFARKIGFTRKMLINDDMGALDRMPLMFGAAGSRLESNIVWGLLLGWDFFTNTSAPTIMYDGKTLFHADHGNLLTTGSAMSETALTALRLLGRKQKTLDGNYLNIAFNEIVAPEDLETTCEKLLQNSFIAAKSVDTNSFINKLKFRIEPRLAAVSTSAYMSFTSNKTVDTFEYAYLAGEEQMMVEVVNSTDVDGMQVKVRHDFGAGVNDVKGMGYATGEV